MIFEDWSTFDSKCFFHHMQKETDWSFQEVISDGQMTFTWIALWAKHKGDSVLKLDNMNPSNLNRTESRDYQDFSSISVANKGAAVLSSKMKRSLLGTLSGSFDPKSIRMVTQFMRTWCVRLAFYGLLRVTSSGSAFGEPSFTDALLDLNSLFYTSTGEIGTLRNRWHLGLACKMITGAQ